MAIFYAGFFFHIPRTIPIIQSPTSG
jgi:hypothetical protein